MSEMITTELAERLIGLLLACVNDPMWADHSEVPKSILTKAADAK